MCNTCRQREAEADSQANWLRSFGLNPYADAAFRAGYLDRLRGCPEEGQVRDEGSRGRDPQ